MSLELTGKLIAIYETQQVKENFKKREFVVELSDDINGNVYTNYAKMQLINAKCEIVDRFKEGDIVKVSFNVKGNRWERDGKVNYITNLDAWRIESAQSSAGGADNASYANMANETSASAFTQGAYNNFNQDSQKVDDLPF